MKKIILARHAKSDFDNAVSDMKRVLNERGRHDAPVMADYLKAQQVDVDCIISSPALRALETSEFYVDRLLKSNQQFKIDVSIYEAGEADLLKIINQLDAGINSVMLVGHNPTFTTLANSLANEHILDMPACSVVAIDFNVLDWRHVKVAAGAMVRFDYPDKLKSL